MRVFLRALELEDHVLLHKWRADCNVNKLLVGNTFFVSREREKASIEQKMHDDSKNIYIGVCDKETAILIGYTSITNLDLRNSKAEINFYLGDKKFWGKGLGKEAVKLTLKFLFEQYPLNKCYGKCLEEHAVSQKIFLSLGFKKDGVLRNEIFKNGEFKNILVYSLLRSEINGQF